MTTDTRKPLPLTYDPLILGCVLLLVGLGLVMVYSASAVTAQEKLGNSFHYLERQGIAACLGLLAMATAMKLGYRRMARLRRRRRLLGGTARCVRTRSTRSP